MPHARNLVVYFSRTGITRRVALSLAAALEADIEEIVEEADRSGLRGYMRSLIDVITGRPVRVAPVRHDISSYELVVIGTPVWAASVSSPVRAWLLANRSQLRRVAFFCTLGGRGHDAALAQMGSLAQRRPLATCAIAAREIRRGEERRLIDIFTHRPRIQVRPSRRTRMDGLTAMDDGLKRKVVGILAQGRHLALATVREDGYPQVNTVSYAFDGLVLYFGTSRYSTKIRNIQRCGKISLAITLPYDDWSQIQGLSMAAIAHVLADDSAGSARAMNMLRQRFSAAWDVSPPTGPGQIVFVELVPSIVSLIDYTKAFSYSETVEIGAGDLNAPLG